MKALNIITLILAIVGGINWGLVAVGGYDMDLVANVFGGADTLGARIIYGVVGLSAVWQLAPLFKAFSIGEPNAEAGRAVHRSR